MPFELKITSMYQIIIITNRNFSFKMRTQIIAHHLEMEVKQKPSQKRIYIFQTNNAGSRHIKIGISFIGSDSVRCDGPLKFQLYFSLSVNISRFSPDSNQLSRRIFGLIYHYFCILFTPLD